MWSSAWCGLVFSGRLQEGSFPFDVEATSEGAQLLVALLNSEGPAGSVSAFPLEASSEVVKYHPQQSLWLNLG